MDDAAMTLKNLRPSKDFFIGFDSDGCVFDTMEIKHKECFCPNTIRVWELQIVSRYARETWEFVNLYSKSRGINRFLALIRTMELLQKRKEVIERNAAIPDLSPLAGWTCFETKLGNPALSKYVERSGDPVLKKTLEWSNAINTDISRTVKGIPPFPFARKSIEHAAEKADIITVSSTPLEALEKEWKEHSIDSFVRTIAGQESGSKTEHLRFAAKGKFGDDRILMVGDAPGDFDAARANGVLFYPIIPGREDDSWERFFREALDRFFSLGYRGEYERELLREFEASLPETPPWEK